MNILFILSVSLLLNLSKAERKGCLVRLHRKPNCMNTRNMADNDGDVIKWFWVDNNQKSMHLKWSALSGTKIWNEDGGELGGDGAFENYDDKGMTNEMASYASAISYSGDCEEVQVFGAGTDRGHGSNCVVVRNEIKTSGACNWACNDWNGCGAGAPLCVNMGTGLDDSMGGLFLEAGWLNKGQGLCKVTTWSGHNCGEHKRGVYEVPSGESKETYMRDFGYVSSFQIEGNCAGVRFEDDDVTTFLDGNFQNCVVRFSGIEGPCKKNTKYKGCVDLDSDLVNDIRIIHLQGPAPLVHPLMQWMWPDRSVWGGDMVKSVGHWRWIGVGVIVSAVIAMSFACRKKFDGVGTYQEV